MKKSLLFKFIFLILTLIILPPSNSFSIQLSMDTISSTSLTTTQTDIAQCSCNLHPSICDNFCCCDTVCSQTQTISWTTSKLCKNKKSNIQILCQNLQQNQAYYSFEDLGCVYYSNRGNIGYFYDESSTTTMNYPISNKFASQTSSSQSINIKSSSADKSNYSSQQNKNILKYTKDTTTIIPKFLQIWSPVAGGDCNLGYITLNQSKIFTCEYSLSILTCEKSTDHLEGIINLCKSGDCTSNSLLTTVKPAALNSLIGCNNVITEQTINIMLSSSGSSYTISSISINFIQNNITYSIQTSKLSIKTSITINYPSTVVSSSGNPGYISGKPITLVTQGSTTSTITSLFSISTPLTGTCTTSKTTPLGLLFNQNKIFSCIIPPSIDPCTSSPSLYIDSIIKQTSLKIQKWASLSSQTINIAGLNSTFNTCSYQTIILNILYTQAGWVEDTQKYIIAAEIKPEKSIQTNWNQKYFKVNWIYVDYNKINQPIQNGFYQYFQYIWKPLRQYFGVYK